MTLNSQIFTPCRLLFSFWSHWRHEFAPCSLSGGIYSYHAFFAERLIPTLSGRVVCAFTKSWPKVSGYKRAAWILQTSHLGRSISYALSLIYFLMYVRVLIFSSVRFIYMCHTRIMHLAILCFSGCFGKCQYIRGWLSKLL